jgi:hypothetical protein
LAQQAEAESGRGSPEILLHKFALSLAPHLQVDWDVELGGAPPTQPLVMVKRKKERRRRPDLGKCIHCGCQVVWRNRRKQGFCASHVTAARQVDAEYEGSDALVARLQAASAGRYLTIANDQPAQTDQGKLFGEILDGLKSFLSNSEWTFPPLRIVPTVTLGANEKRPGRIMMGTLRDVTLLGISDLLLKYGQRIRRCAARNCNQAFLATRRQTFCSPPCAARERFERFRGRLGKDGFRERRHGYYEKAVKRDKGESRVIGRRKQRGKTE